MANSKKPFNEKSILGRIASSIEEIEKCVVDNESKEENNENNKNFEEIKIDNEFLIFSKADEVLENDSRRKFSFLLIIGSILGLILVVIGIFLMLGTSERVVDTVVSGEIGTISIFIIFLGIVILNLSIFKFFSRKGPISETFDNIHDLQLLDEDEHYEKIKNEDKKDSKTNSDLIDENHDIELDNTDSSLNTDSNNTDFEDINILDDNDSQEDIHRE